MTLVHDDGDALATMTSVAAAIASSLHGRRFADSTPATPFRYENGFTFDDGSARVVVSETPTAHPRRRTPADGD